LLAADSKRAARQRVNPAVKAPAANTTNSKDSKDPNAPLTDDGRGRSVHEGEVVL